jgi:hypothetical protein
VVWIALVSTDRLRQQARQLEERRRAHSPLLEAYPCTISCLRRRTTSMWPACPLQTGCRMALSPTSCSPPTLRVAPARIHRLARSNHSAADGLQPRCYTGVDSILAGKPGKRYEA